MAMVVGLSAIITQPLHRVVGGDMLWMLLYEFLGAVPDRGDGFGIFIKTEHETIFLFVVRHKLERVVGDVAENFDAWFHPPVPLVILQEGLLEEEPRLEAAHVSIAYRVAVDDFALGHVLSHFLRFALIDPLWK